LQQQETSYRSTAMSAMAQLLAASSSGFNDEAVDLLCANNADAKFTRGFGSVDGVCVGSSEVNAISNGSCEDITE